MAEESALVKLVKDFAIEYLGEWAYWGGRKSPTGGQAPAPSSKLASALARVEDSKKQERAKWLIRLAPAKKAQLETFSPEALDDLLKQDDPAQRDLILKATLQPTASEVVASFKEKIQNAAPQLPQTAANVHTLSERWGHKARLKEKEEAQQQDVKSGLRLIYEFFKQLLHLD